MWGVGDQMSRHLVWLLRARRLGWLACLGIGCLGGELAGAVELPRAPVTIRCYQGGDLVIAEPLTAMPRKEGTRWTGERWAGAEGIAGGRIVIDQGQDAVCLVTEGAAPR